MSQRKRGQEFAELCNRILNADENGLQDYADYLGMSYTTFYARLRGNTIFSPDEIRILLSRCNHEDLVHYFLEESDWYPVKRELVTAPNKAFLENTPSFQPKKSEPVRKAAQKHTLLAAQILDLTEQLLSDHPKDHRDRHQLTQHLNEAENMILAIRYWMQKRV